MDFLLHSSVKHSVIDANYVAYVCYVPDNTSCKTKKEFTANKTFSSFFFQTAKSLKSPQTKILIKFIKPISSCNVSNQVGNSCKMFAYTWFMTSRCVHWSIKHQMINWNDWTWNDSNRKTTTAQKTLIDLIETHWYGKLLWRNMYVLKNFSSKHS